MKNEPLLLPQYAASLIPQHVEQFRESSAIIAKAWNALGECLGRIASDIVSIMSRVVTDIVSSAVQVIQALPHIPYALRKPRYRPGKQTRHYLAVKRRAYLRTRRHGHGHGKHLQSVV